MRQDLLALTTDDLVTLSNRGLVKRSQHEVQAGQLTYELHEDDDGNVSVQWSDAVECQLPSDRTLSNSLCTCPATTLCRHLIRSVLVYQQSTHPPAAASNQNSESHTQNLELSVEGSYSQSGSQSASPPQSSSSPHKAEASYAPHPSSPWNPGDITDATLAQHFKKAALSKLKHQFDQGHVLSLTRSSKPIAHIHTLSCTIRFLVAGDVRYTHCDCAEMAPCSHAPLAVWAFRLLETTQTSGIVSTRETAYPVPTALLDAIEQQLEQTAQLGLAGSASASHDRLRRLEHRCRESGFIWLAEILAELVQAYVAYENHDARFSPQAVMELIGELCIRSDAIRYDTGAVPQLFIRGSDADRVMEVGSARLVGLGCGVQLRQHSVTLTAYCQDVDAGTIVAMCRHVSDPTDNTAEPAKDFWQLAQAPVLKGISLAQLGTGQLLVKGGKRTPNYQFLPGRTPVSFNPQAYQWEALRSPALVEDLTELSAQLSALPPASLRPRRLTENLYVCRIATVEAVVFDAVSQSVQARLRDREGNTITLLHPYTTRGRDGTEALLAALNQQPEAVQFVAGQVRLSHQGLVIAPIALVLQQANGRIMLQPWIDRAIEQPFHREGKPAATPLSADLCASPAFSSSASPAPSASPAFSSSIPHIHYLQQLTTALSELFLTGLQRVDSPTIRYWQDLDRQGAALGFVRLRQPIQQLAGALAHKPTTLYWQEQPAAEAMLSIALLLKLIQEEFGG